MHSAGLLSISEGEKSALPLAAAILMGVLIGVAVGPWGDEVALVLLGAVGVLLFYIVLVFEVKWGLLLLLILLPLQHVDLAAGHLGFVLSPIRLMLPGLVVAWLVCRIRRRVATEAVPINHRLLAPMVSLLSLICLSAAFSQNWPVSVASLPGFAEGVVVFALVVDMIRTEELLQRSILALCIAIGVIAFTQVYDVSDLLMAPEKLLAQAQVSLGRIRVRSVFGDEPNGAAHFVAILFPLLLYALTISKSKLRTWMLGLVGLTAMFGLLLTFSRGGLLALLAGVVVSYRRRISARVIVVLLVLAVILTATPVSTLWAENVGARPESASKRLELWTASLRSALEYPLFGTGFGTFKYLHRYTSFDWHPDLFASDDPNLNKSAHNFYLSLVAETGFLSWVFLSIFWWQSLRLLLKLSRQTSSAGMHRQWWLVQCLLGCSAALLISRLFTTGFSVLAFWALLGILISASSIIEASVDGATQSALPGGEGLGESPLS
jgi:O-antigen ligase